MEWKKNNESNTRALTKCTRETQDSIKRSSLGAKSSFGKFYVYDDVDWMAMKCDGHSVEDVFRKNLMVSETRSGKNGHFDDFWFLKHALEHPNRTRKPEEATLFVVWLERY